jgi:hypothetical protein
MFFFHMLPSPRRKQSSLQTLTLKNPSPPHSTAVTKTTLLHTIINPVEISRGDVVS